VFVFSVLVSTVLAAVIGTSAARKLSRTPKVVASYKAAGVPESWLPGLAVVLLAAAAALIVGLWWAPAGIAAAGGLVAYFAVAVAFHIRANDRSHAGMPIALAILALAALTIRTLAL
jgi:DoxX-like family